MSINKKVSELTAASALTGTELFYADDGTNDVQVTLDEITAYAVADSDVVHKSGTETITGVKTFVDGAIRTQNTGDDTFSMGVHSTGTLTADRALNVNLNDADRTVSLGGNVTTTGALAMSGAFSLTWTVTGNTNVTLPTAGTLATLSGVETLSNKTLGVTNTVTLRSDRWTLQDAADNTKQLAHSLTGITTATTRTATWPDADITVVGTTATQTLENKTFRDNTFTIQDNADTTKQFQFQASGITTATTRTITVPDANITIVGTDATQTLTNKTLTSPVINNPTITGLSLTGTTTNDNAGVGIVGEYVTSAVGVGSAVSLTTATPANVTSISLTAGDWNVWGQAGFDTTGTTDFTQLIGCISRTSATLTGGSDDTNSRFALVKPAGATGTTVDNIFAVPICRVSIASTTTVYLVAQAAFSASTVGAFGFISARRMR